MSNKSLPPPQLRPFTGEVQCPKSLLAYLKAGCEIHQAGNDKDKNRVYHLVAPGISWQVAVAPAHVQALETLKLIEVDCCGEGWWVSKAALELPNISGAITETE